MSPLNGSQYSPPPIYINTDPRSSSSAPVRGAFTPSSPSTNTLTVSPSYVLVSQIVPPIAMRDPGCCIVLVLLTDAKVCNTAAIREKVLSVGDPVVADNAVPVAVSPDLTPCGDSDLLPREALKVRYVDKIVLQNVAVEGW
eukprot:TRINITY_DN1903_c0_g1_i1.p1 TRINITY_DN1903_c0_g1~~TRINITY_DN1903_c0_g1_i1.p1  ORF type:complete len:141 (-),score=1.66 TRINITY_DN1903_c0_g1_i1:739-1161(-)